MDKQSEKYLDDIVTNQAFATDKKYRKGQQEHGGKLWEKPGMLKNIEDEITDQGTYVFTLRKQLNIVFSLLGSGDTIGATEMLRMILGDPEEPTLNKLITDYQETWTALKNK